MSEEKSNDKLSKKFYNGCKRLGLDKEAISKLKYRGRSTLHEGKMRANKYFHFVYGKDKEAPERKGHCICGNKIKDNYFVGIDNNIDNMIVLGSCCKNRFLPEKYRKKTCLKCEKPHKRRISGLCKECERESNLKKCDKCYCRVRYLSSSGLCKDCSLPICIVCNVNTVEKKYYTRCLSCFENACYSCQGKKKKGYRYCYKCYIKEKTESEDDDREKGMDRMEEIKGKMFDDP